MSGIKDNILGSRSLNTDLAKYRRARKGHVRALRYQTAIAEKCTVMAAKLYIVITDISSETNYCNSIINIE